MGKGCEAKCQAREGCRFYALGKGPAHKKGKCYEEFATTRTCNANVWKKNDYDIYQMKAPKISRYHKYNTDIHIRNLYGSGTYLDVCGHASCGGGYNVITHGSKNRANQKTAHWSF